MVIRLVTLNVVHGTALDRDRASGTLGTVIPLLKVSVACMAWKCQMVSVVARYGTQE
jgi:hypothetical protein